MPAGLLPDGCLTQHSPVHNVTEFHEVPFSFGPLTWSMRLQPVLADADLHLDGHVERDGGLHLLLDQRRALPSPRACRGRRPVRRGPGAASGCWRLAPASSRCDADHGELDHVGGGALDGGVDGVALGGAADGVVGGVDVAEVAAAAGEGLDVAVLAGVGDGAGPCSRGCRGTAEVGVDDVAPLRCAGCRGAGPGRRRRCRR